MLQSKGTSAFLGRQVHDILLPHGAILGSCLQSAASRIQEERSSLGYDQACTTREIRDLVKALLDESARPPVWQAMKSPTQQIGVAPQELPLPQYQYRSLRPVILCCLWLLPPPQG